ncbi:MAG: ribbon-helix-helix protein, CopG family [Elusimicrobia bacterium]|nr:ribbon-helix-helix protein, CopG family [Elusimicrobiota bacterium]
MTKKRKSTDAELRRYYDKTSLIDEGRPGRRVRMEFPKPGGYISLRLEESAVRRIENLAARRGVNFSTMLRMWITERLRRETA